MDERLIECKQLLRCVIAQADLFDGDCGSRFENIPVPDDLESCERRVIEIVKKETLEPTYIDFPHPIYFAGFISAYEWAFRYLVGNGLAKWRYDDGSDFIYFEGETA